MLCFNGEIITLVYLFGFMLFEDIQDNYFCGSDKFINIRVFYGIADYSLFFVLLN